jgi:peptidoglycan hydrolase CwlO-like protein
MSKEMMLQAELNRKLVELKNAKAKIDKLYKEIDMYKQQIQEYENDIMDDKLPEINND